MEKGISIRNHTHKKIMTKNNDYFIFQGAAGDKIEISKFQKPKYIKLLMQNVPEWSGTRSGIIHGTLSSGTLTRFSLKKVNVSFNVRYFFVFPILWSKDYLNRDHTPHLNQFLPLHI